MGSSADEGLSRPKRPSGMARQHSSQSQVSQSPSESHQRPAQHKVSRHHVVGTRVQRNASTGKHLNKLTKAAQQAPATDETARHHRRSQSGNAVSAPSSPRPGFKRNASSGAIVRATQAQAHANLRKNHSSGHLARQGQGKHASKASKGDIAAAKRALATPNRSRQSSPDAHPAIHFDVDSDQGGDDGWTEESASQSPTTTRSNTRSNSVILDQQHRTAEKEGGASRPPPAGGPSNPSQAAHTLADRTRHNTHANGGGSHHHSRPPDADMITSRLLQRSSASTTAAQNTSGAATERESTRSVLPAHSAASTLVDTPGRDLVSRFMDGHGSAGTPANGDYMPPRDEPRSEEGELDESKRNKSTPNVQRSGTTTPTLNRTQQKLLLQRASSAIEPQKLVPAVMARAGVFPSGIQYNANSEGRVDPRLLQQFNHVAVEYKVVRRYRNPLADSIWRIQQISGVKQRINTRVPKSASLNGSTSTSSLSTSLNESGVEVETDGASSRRSRVSFDTAGRPSRDDEDLDRESLEEEHVRPPTEAEEICRRMWESAEVVEAD